MTTVRFQPLDTAPGRPELSVVLVAYRSEADLARCLPSLLAQEDVTTEIIVVDNGPGATSAAWLRANHPEIRVLVNSDNTGYAGGNNRAIEAATGAFVLVLNPDTFVHPGALRRLVDVARAHPNSLINPLLVHQDGSINACGTEMHYTGISTCRGLGQSADAYAGLQAVPLLSGAAFITRRELLARLGGFDEDFFMYFEDIDLALRAKLLGYSILCATDAVVTHFYQQIMTPGKFYHLERNRLLTLFKIFRGDTLRALTPSLILTELATWSYAFVKGPSYLAARWRGYRWLWRNRGAWFHKRRHIQDNREISDDLLLQDCLIGLPYDQLVDHGGLARWLDALTKPAYRLLRPRFG